MKITINDFIGKNENESKLIAYNYFYDYAKKHAKYINHMYNFNSIEYTINYIANGIYIKYDYLVNKHIEKNDIEKNNNVYFQSIIHVMSLIKKIKSNLNYASYCNYDEDEKMNNDVSQLNKKVIGNTHYITIVDVLEQWENRDARTAQKKNVYFEDDNTFINTIKSYYGTPESDLLNKLSKMYSHKMAIKIRSDKKYYKIIDINNKLDKDYKLNQSDYDFIKYFKNRLGISELNYKEIRYIVDNY